MTYKNNFQKALAGAARCGLLACATATFALASNVASAAETVRLAMSTQSWWPTTVAMAADRLKFFEKEGVKAEITVYKGGGPSFEALAANAADMNMNPAYLVALGRNKGVNSKIVASASTVYPGWHLVVAEKSPIKTVADLAGKKVGVTANGSITDFLALWTARTQKISFTRIPVGGGGLIPNLLNGNIDAAVVFSPLSFKLLSNNSGRSLIDFGKVMQPDLNAAWIATDSFIKDHPKAVQGTLNALYGAVVYLQKHKDYAVKLIAELNDLPPKVADLEYENSIMGASTNSTISPKAVAQSIEMAKLGGLTNLAPAESTYVTTFKAVPTQP